VEHNKLWIGDISTRVTNEPIGIGGALPGDSRWSYGVTMSVLDDHAFALCLTHDVDRPYKTYQTVYNAWTERDPTHLLDLLPHREPYWQFGEIMRIEEELGVRSAFYFLNEKHLLRDKPVRTWFRPKYWKLFLGRYTLSDPSIREAIRTLDDGGWEVGLHGSFESYRDRERLRQEKETVEEVLGHRIWGGRQHYLNLDRPETWRHYANIGLRYDTSLGSSTEYGFQHGYEPLRPFDDEFVVFPLTLMELTLPDVSSSPDLAWEVCEALLGEAHENDAVMTVLWHPCYFSEQDFPNYGRLYRRLIERALEMGAWVGPPADLYASLDHPSGSVGSGPRDPVSGVDRADRTANGDEETIERDSTGAAEDGGLTADRGSESRPGVPVGSETEPAVGNTDPAVGETDPAVGDTDHGTTAATAPDDATIPDDNATGGRSDGTDPCDSGGERGSGSGGQKLGPERSDRTQRPEVSKREGR